MSEKTQAQEVSAALSEAIFKAGNSSKGVLVAIALENGAVSFFGSGDFVTKQGLFKCLEERAHKHWNDGEDIIDP